MEMDCLHVEVNRKYAKDLMWIMSRTAGITIYGSYPAYWQNDIEVIEYGGDDAALAQLEIYVDNDYTLGGKVNFPSMEGA